MEAIYEYVGQSAWAPDLCSRNRWPAALRDVALGHTCVPTGRRALTPHAFYGLSHVGDKAIVGWSAACSMMQVCERISTVPGCYVRLMGLGDKILDCTYMRRAWPHTFGLYFVEQRWKLFNAKSGITRRRGKSCGIRKGPEIGSAALRQRAMTISGTRGFPMTRGSMTPARAIWSNVIHLVTSVL